MYVDECGFDSALIREYGRCLKSQRLLGERSGKRFARTSIIAGLWQNKPVAPMYFEGYCNTEVVWTWVKEVFIPESKPGMVLVMDNASFHKSPRITELFTGAGVNLVFLPPYSPDLNPIEQFWAKMKWALTSLIRLGQTLEASLHAFFQNTTF